jgi:hypothetical protein
MAPKIARFSLALGACLVVSFGLLTLTTLGVAKARQSDMPGMPGMAKQKTMSVTGCVQKGLEARGFYLTDADGKVWELSAKSVKLDKLVGETATVAGHEVHLSKAAEAKLESSEMKEAAGKTYGDFQVTSVKNVTPGCGG